MSEESLAAEPAVRDLYTRLLDAWNRRSADDFAALFAGDGTVIGFDGSVMTGDEVREQLTAIFADHPTAGYLAKVREVRPVGATAVLLRAIVGMVPPGGTDLNPAVNAHQTMVADRHDGTWRIVLFQNTPAQYHGRPHLVEQHTAELRRLLTGRPATG
ncbi:SgcJ/EcaC family oxidoreductase [Planosporangium sp. 12N6]|uniref:SgcJ/EcaC family oxidoreductase n=1 Tax=Planosporangium spinosum TaxID=3402278 RepID=UPI003CEBAF77